MTLVKKGLASVNPVKRSEGWCRRIMVNMMKKGRAMRKLARLLVNRMASNPELLEEDRDDFEEISDRLFNKFRSI